MINFIIYEDEKQYINTYESTIHKFMALNNDCYRIYKYNEYSLLMNKKIQKLTGQNIYILGLEVDGKSGLDLAKEIRNISKTTDDQIIITTSHMELVTNVYHRKALVLDFLSKYDDLEGNLFNCFKDIYLLFNKNKFLSFKVDGEILRIPYDDILYIEKNKEDNCVYIYTEKDRLKYKNNIVNLEKHLEEDMRFFRTHRSVIVNVNKIVKVDMSNLVIYFSNKNTCSLARDKKKNLEKRLNVMGS